MVCEFFFMLLLQKIIAEVYKEQSNENGDTETLEHFRKYYGKNKMNVFDRITHLQTNYAKSYLLFNFQDLCVIKEYSNYTEVLSCFIKLAALLTWLNIIRKNIECRSTCKSICFLSIPTRL